MLAALLATRRIPVPPPPGFPTQLQAVTTTFACVSMAQLAATLTTNKGIIQTLLFSLPGSESIVDGLERLLQRLISARASNDLIFFQTTVTQTNVILANLNRIIQGIPSTIQNMFVLSDLQSRMNFAVSIMQGALSPFEQ